MTMIRSIVLFFIYFISFSDVVFCLIHNSISCFSNKWCQLQHANVIVPVVTSKSLLKFKPLLAKKSLFAELDIDEAVSLQRISSNYLISKYKGCDEENCRVFCTRDDIVQILTAILPPVTKEELNKEIDLTMSKFNSDDIDEADFIAAIIDNTYWAAAGPLVVKELIYLDSLYSYYLKGQKAGLGLLLSDDDYAELKDQLTWEGSDVVSMSSKEAVFIMAVAASQRGQSIFTNAEYDSLKQELLSKGSWVVTRKPDSLEKMGLNTYVGYLHRSL